MKFSLKALRARLTKRNHHSNHRVTFNRSTERVYHEVPEEDRYSVTSKSASSSQLSNSFDSTASDISVNLNACVPATHQLYIILRESSEKINFDLSTLDMSSIISNFAALRAILMIFNQLDNKGFRF